MWVRGMWAHPLHNGEILAASGFRRIACAPGISTPRRDDPAACRFSVPTYVYPSPLRATARVPLIYQGETRRKVWQFIASRRLPISTVMGVHFQTWSQSWLLDQFFKLLKWTSPWLETGRTLYRLFTVSCRVGGQGNPWLMVVSWTRSCPPTQMVKRYMNLHRQNCPTSSDGGDCFPSARLLKSGMSAEMPAQIVTGGGGPSPLWQ